MLLQTGDRVYKKLSIQIHKMGRIASTTISRNKYKGGRGSYSLGGRSSADQENNWAPNSPAIKATIRYVIATERFKWEPKEILLSQRLEGSE